MAPFRSSRNTRAGPARGQNDNDTLDGLPIRQWRKVDAVVGASDATSNITDAPRRGVGIWKELPMPDGSQNYPAHSQKLLRAARVGRILDSEEIIRNFYRKGRGEDEKDADADGAEEGMNEEIRGVKRDAQGFHVKRWAQLSRQQEESHPEYLAKRREGLPSMHHIPAVDATNMRQIRVRGTDANGISHTYEVLIADGKTISSEYREVTDGEDITKPPPGTMIEGLGVANEHGVIVYSEPPVQLFGRGRQPPPRRKPKRGPGRGKKKIGFAPVVNTIGTDGRVVSVGGDGSEDVTMLNTEDGTANTPAAGDDDGEEGEDDDEEDGEGEDGDADPDADAENDDDREEGELTPDPPTAAETAQALERFESTSTSLPPASESLPSKPPTIAPDPIPHAAQEAEASSEGSYEPELNTATLAPEADTEMEEPYEPELTVPTQAPNTSSYETEKIPQVDTPTEASYEPELEMSTNEPNVPADMPAMGSQPELAVGTLGSSDGALPVTAEGAIPADHMQAPSASASTAFQIPGLSLTTSPPPPAQMSVTEPAVETTQGGDIPADSVPMAPTADVLSSLENDLGGGSGEAQADEAA